MLMLFGLLRGDLSLLVVVALVDHELVVVIVDVIVFRDRFGALVLLLLIRV